MPNPANAFTTVFLVNFPKKITAKGQLVSESTKITCATILYLLR